MFVPILAGATLGDRLLACCGAMVGIGLTGLICSLMFGHDPHLPLLVAPVGASSVLLFAVPASPLAQPWSIIGGNMISALMGIIVGRFIHDPMLAVGVAVGFAIAAMSLTRCLHPPGGAAALTAILGGPAVTAAGFTFALVPVALNSVLLVLLGWLFHKFSRHSYPHKPKPAPANTHGTTDPSPQLRVGFRGEDVDGALSDLGEAFDIDREDLDRLLRQVELRALRRAQASLTCADIMSRHVISIDGDAAPQTARALLLQHNIRTLPVIDEEATLLGAVGLRELTRQAFLVRQVMSPAVFSKPEASAFELIASLTDGATHAVVIVDEAHHVVGLVTQTDLLTAISRIPALREEVSAE